MKKGIAVLLLTIFPLLTFSENLKNNPFVKELVPKIKTKTEIKVYKIKIKKAHFAHPQKFTPKEVNKIFHCLKINGIPSILIFNSKEIREITNSFIKEFETTKPNEAVVVEKNKIYFDAKNKKTLLTKTDKVTFSFPDNNTLKAIYFNKGYDFLRSLKKGFHVKHLKKDGITYISTVLITRDVWTTNLNKAVFEKDYEKTLEELPKTLRKENKKIEQVNQQKQETISIEEMQKELTRLKNMLDKKLITEEQYNVLKKRVLKKAGL